MSPEKTSIKILPEHLIDQIKAGEVIERPANVFKELIENSVDAGSTKIEIHLVNNGLDLITIKDNGRGISKNDLPYAFVRHATSKLTRFEDLYNLYTFGFRGEALASIAAVSKIQCVSSTGKAGSKISLQGAEIIAQDDYPTQSSGTEIYIKDIFYNTPARLKFIKSQRVEKNNIQKMINSFLLCHSQIDFSIRWDDSDREVYKSSSQKDRVAKIFSHKLKESDIEFIKREYDGTTCEVFFSKLSSKGNQNKKHFIFVNHRLVYDKSLHSIILNCLKRYWPEFETGHYCLFLDVPPTQVDVNVHPNKIQVKFQNISAVQSLVSSAVKTYIEQISDQDSIAPHRVEKPLELNQFDINNYDLKPKNNMLQEQSSFTVNLPAQDDDQFSFFQDENKYQILFQYSSGNSVLLYNKELFFFNQNELIKAHLKKSYILNREFNEENAPPLLISKPFQFSSSLDDYQQLLLSMGLEFDRLDSDTIALRSMPLFYNELPANELIQQVLHQIENMGGSPDTDFFKDINLTQAIPKESLMCILEKFSFAELLQSKVFYRINERDLIK